jgi:hypothetical protein
MAKSSTKNFLHDNLFQLISATQASLINPVIGTSPTAIESGIVAIQNLALNINSKDMQDFIENMLNSLSKVQGISEEHRAHYKDCVFFVVNVIILTNFNKLTLFRQVYGELLTICLIKETF